MEGPARPSINHHLHEEVEESQRQNANHLRLCLPRNVQGSMMPHTENDTHHGKIFLRGRYYPPRTSTDEHGNTEYISLVQCCSVWFNGRTIPAEVCLSAGDITNHGRPRTSTETRNMYSLVLCSSVQSVVKPYPQKSVSQREILPTTDEHGQARKRGIYILSSV